MRGFLQRKEKSWNKKYPKEKEHTEYVRNGTWTPQENLDVLVKNPVVTGIEFLCSKA